MFDWITGFVDKTGYLGIALLMLAENVFPPIPSELIMPLAGFTAARGELSMVGVVLSGTAGSAAGACLWYLLGRWVGLVRLRSLAARHGRWLTLTSHELEESQAFFSRHCRKAEFFGRLIPGVRTLISVPAGIVKMGFGLFLVCSLLGTVIWTSLLAGAGYLLESQYQVVGDWLNPVTNIIAVVAVLIYFYRVVTFRPCPA